jgi:hypothetical protein
MRYILAYPHLLKVNKFCPEDEQSLEAIRVFNLISDDLTIKYSPREYQIALREANNLILINTSSQTWVKVSKQVENILTKLSEGNLFLEGRWRSGIMPLAPLSYFAQVIILATTIYVENNQRLPNNPNELAITISGLLLS